MATNKILHFVFLAPFALIIYTFIFFLFLKYKTTIPKTMVFNISCVFFVIIPFYFKYSLEIFDDLMEGCRVIFVRLKKKFGKELISIGNNLFYFN